MPAAQRFAATLLLAGGLTATSMAAAETSAPLDEAAVRDIIRSFIQENPELIQEALRADEARAKLEAQQRQREALRELRAELVEHDASPVWGNPGGDVTIVEFSEYNCGFCRRAFPALQAVVEQDPGVRIVIKELPILSEGSVEAARLALAAHEQGRFLEMHEALMALEGRATRETALAVARELGLDVERLTADAGEPSVDAELAKNRELADRIGITGTPAFIIGDRLLPGAVGAGRLQALVALQRTRQQREAAAASRGAGDPQS
jgi:protein-disulfide isomerase